MRSDAAAPPWFFSEASLKAGGRVQLDRAEAKHAVSVLRLRTGASVELFDGAGRVAAGELGVADDSRKAWVDVRSVRDDPRPGMQPTSDSDPNRWITLVTAAPKGPRADVLVDQAVQLGVSRLVWLKAERSVAVPHDKKLQRWRAGVRESCKQARRSWLMELAGPFTVSDVLANAPAVLGVPDANPEAPAMLVGISHVARDQPVLPASAASVALFVGPEGGWTAAETGAMEAAGVTPWRFAWHVLRIETACAAGVSALASSVC